MSDEERNKKVFQNREIEPSGEAWNKLESLLDSVDAQEKKKRIFWRRPLIAWASVAAVTILLVLSYFIQQPTERILETPSSQVVWEKVPQEKENQPSQAQEKKAEIVPSAEKELVTQSPLMESKKITSVEKVIPKTEAKNERNIAISTIKTEKKVEKSEIVFHSPDDSILLNKKPEQQLNENLSIAFEDTPLKLNSEKESIQLNPEGLLSQIEDEIYWEENPNLLEKIEDKLEQIQLVFSKRNQKKE